MNDVNKDAGSKSIKEYVYIYASSPPKQTISNPVSRES